MVAVVGREVEMAAVAELLDGLDGGPATLALWGEAGIGKSTIWEAGVADARYRGYAVLVCRPAATEVRMSYSGLADLVVDVPVASLDALPPPQRRALDAALLRGADDDPAPDPRAVAAGFLSLLDGVAAVSPVLVAVDDLQWLDEPTRRVVRYALRRCRGRVVALSAERTDADVGAAGELHPPDPARLRRVRVPPLSLGALHDVLLQGTGRSFPRPVMVRIAERSGGNPFFALEIASVVDVDGSVAGAFPVSLGEVVQAHIGALALPVREALLVASALSEPGLELVGRASGGADAAALLAPAEDSGVVELVGSRVRFTHPLLANGVYAGASPARRRELHHRLSGLVDDVEERARHLALAATGFDAGTVRALDVAAERARRRGAASTAAELLELAIGLGAADPTRQIDAARDHFHADDPARATELLETAIAEIDAGPERGEALGLLAAMVFQVGGYGRAVELLEQALDEVGADPRLRASIAYELGMALANGGRVADAMGYGTIAVEAAEAAADDGLLAEALGGSVIIRFLNGQGVDEDGLARALRLEDPERRSHMMQWPSFNAMVVYLSSHQLDRARAALAALHERCVERGAESDLWIVLGHATTAALWDGDIGGAERLVVELTERARMTGTELAMDWALTAQAHVAAWEGRIDEARAIAGKAAASMADAGAVVPSLFACTVLGMAELSAGDHSAAAKWLGPAAAQMAAIGYGEPAIPPLYPDAAEALIALGRFGEAEPLVDLLEASGRNPGRTWAEAMGARCRGLLAGGRGGLDEAAVAFERALAAHDRLPLRYDKARTLLAVAQLQRRRNQRRAAKSSLEQAADLFDQVGAARWAANARADLDRLGLRPGRPDQLTPSEARIAALAATGMTNRAVAATLFVSPKTVEANLSRAYRKLGIRTRAELGRRMAERSDAEGPSAK